MSPVPERPTVVFVGHVARLSGGEIALLYLVEALGDRVDAVVLLAEDGPLVAALRDVGATVEVLELDEAVRDTHRDQVTGALALRRAAALARYVWRLRRRLRAIDPDVVHTNTLKAAFYGGLAARLARLPVVWHVRDRIAPDYLPPRVVGLVRLAARVIPHEVIANSQATLATLPRGVVVRDLVRNMRAPAAPRTQTGLAVGLAGRLTPWKGQDLFLRAFAAAFPASDARAVLIGSALFGEDDYATSLHVLVAELGLEARTEFRGFRPDMPHEYARLDLLVHYSTVPEPYGQVVVEGMSAGLCVLAADEGGPREIIVDGVNGVLVRPRSVEALTEALKRWAPDADGRARIGLAAQLAATDTAGPTASVEQVLDLYGALTARIARNRRARSPRL